MQTIKNSEREDEYELDKHEVSIPQLLGVNFLNLTPRQIQYGGFRRACLGKSGDMIRDRVRILCLLFLCFTT